MQNNRLTENYWLNSFLNSYSLMLFSLNKLLGAILVLVTFFIPKIGFWGASAVIAINGLAYVLGFNRNEIKEGLIGFNALFLGMGLGYYYVFNLSFLVLFFSSILTLLLVTVFFKGLLESFKLPFLSLPFIVTFWLVGISAAGLESVRLDEGHIYQINELALNQNSSWFSFTHSLDGLFTAEWVVVYLKTLASIFFQDSILAGLMVAFVIFLHSRIAFLLSVLGFILAYGFYYILGANVNELSHYLVGANFVFLAMAIGGFFYIPNRFTIMATIAMVPVLLVSSMAINRFLGVFFLKGYTLSFSLVSIGFLYVFNQRTFHKYLIPVYQQIFSPEKTIYKYFNNLNRFKYEMYYRLSLPFSGEWFVSQGYYGGITHLGEWGRALDFVIADSNKRTFRVPASGRAEDLTLDHFYCYNKEVISPYDGYVYDIVNSIEENDIGEVNTEKNWGNTVIINHLNGLFSQISHLKKDSIGVFVGQYVNKGTYIGTCGNSGRSPEPHIHFQLQTVPIIGAQPIEYPIAHFIERIGEKRYLRLWEIPKQDSFISNVQTNQILTTAFGFFPGQKIKWKLEGTSEFFIWEVLTNAYNQTYFHCLKTNSKAYFVNDGVLFYFTEFEGDKKSLLFNFYLGAFKVLLGYYHDLTLDDNPPVYAFNYMPIQIVQDFFAPLILFTQTKYDFAFAKTDNPYAPQFVEANTSVSYSVFTKQVLKKEFVLKLRDRKLESFTIKFKNKVQRYLFNFID